MDDMSLLYGLLGLAVVGGGGIFFMARRKAAAWEATLDKVARALGGRYTKGRKVELAWIPGEVEAHVDGKEVNLEIETSSEGPSGNSREVKWMAVKVGTSMSKPEFWGPESARKWKVGEVVDYSGGSGNNGASGSFNIGGCTLASKHAGKHLRRALEEDPDAERRVAEHFGAGGCIEAGNVVLRTKQFETDANKLVERIRAMAAIANMIDSK